MVKMDCGTLLRQARLAAGLSRERLAELSGVSVRAISYIESGQTRKPYRRTVQVLADALSLEGAARDQFQSAAVSAAGVPGSPAVSRDRHAGATGTGPEAAIAWPEQARQGNSRASEAGRISVSSRLAPAFPVPAQLPHDVPGFTGRDTELAEMTKLHQRPRPVPLVLAIDGSPGIGKTALAIHWAREAAGDFPDGQLYIDLQGSAPPACPLTPAAATGELLGALGIPPERIPAGSQAQTGLYRSLLAGRRVLIVLDNALDEQQVRPLLPGDPGCTALVTSRNELPGLIATDGAHPLTLELLSYAEAHDLLARRLGAGPLAAEPQAAAELIQLCARLPLALTVAVARAAARRARALQDIAADLRALPDS